jgi:poly-gamma-glutamate capsule biosynthesis protein CapA/YwtB (metallophosphatase superfamily)
VWVRGEERGRRKLYEPQNGSFTLAAVGDIIATRRLNVFRDEGFLRTRHLLQEADCAFANLEAPMNDRQFFSSPERDLAASHPESVEDLKWLGINAISFGNNHTWDSGTEGMLHSIRLLKEARIRCAGAGKHLQEAAMPGYLDTPRGRVALVSVTSSFEPGSQAGEQSLELQGRAGINCLAYSTTSVVDRRVINDLKRISRELGYEAEKERKAAEFGGAKAAYQQDTETRFHLYDKVFEVGDR